MKKSDRLKPKKKRKYRVKHEPVAVVFPWQLGCAKEIYGVR